MSSVLNKFGVSSLKKTEILWYELEAYFAGNSVWLQERNYSYKYSDIIIFQVFKAVINLMCLRVIWYEFTIISEEPTAPIFRVGNWGLMFFQNFGTLREHDFTSHMTMIFRQHWPKETRNAKERG